MQGLGERLEVVRQKVEEKGERDREGRKAAGRILMMLWGSLGGLVALVLVLVVARHWPGAGVDVRGVKMVELKNRTWDGMDGGEGLGPMGERGEGGEGIRKGKSRSEEAARTSMPEDHILKLFDEL